MTEKLSHDPISVPAGSYSLQDLEKLGDAAARAPAEKRDALVADRLEKARVRVEGEPDSYVPGMLPGHKLVDVELVRDEGTETKLPGGKTETIGRVVENRTIQVFDEKLAKEETTAAEEATPALASGSAARSEGSK
jgi:hypothetical protein